MSGFRLTTLLIANLIFASVRFPLHSLDENPGSGSLKTVLILDFINIEKKQEFNYLETSITGAVTSKLAKMFAFEQTTREVWERIAQDNFFPRDEFYTRSAGMNLGLLTKQDIVISGGFRILESRKESKISILVRFFDIGQRKMIAEFNVDGPASNRIFETINQVAEKISVEAANILPNKEAWEQKGVVAPMKQVFLSNFQVGVSTGGGFYLGGWMNDYSSNFPSVSVWIRGNIVPVSFKPIIQIDLQYFSHTFAETTASPLAQMGLSLAGHNFLAGISAGKDFQLPKNFFLTPMIGAGILFQRTEIMGFYQTSVNNGFFYASAIIEAGYRLNSSISAGLTIGCNFIFEDNLFTTFTYAHAGLIFYLNN